MFACLVYLYRNYKTPTIATIITDKVVVSHHVISNAGFWNNNRYILAHVV